MSTFNCDKCKTLSTSCVDIKIIETKLKSSIENDLNDKFNKLFESVYKINEDLLKIKQSNEENYDYLHSEIININTSCERINNKNNGNSNTLNNKGNKER